VVVRVRVNIQVKPVHNSYHNVCVCVCVCACACACACACVCVVVCTRVHVQALAVHSRQLTSQLHDKTVCLSSAQVCVRQRARVCDCVCVCACVCKSVFSECELAC